MKNHTNTSAEAAELRRKAEARLRTPATKGPLARTEADAQRLVHELQVHQIELQMQNEELHRSQAEVEAGLERYSELYDFAPVGYMTLDRDGAILQVNLTGARLLGMERARLPGRRLGMFVGESDRAVFHAFLEKVFKSRGKEECEVVLLKEGQRPINVNIMATVSQEGQECRVVMVDITEGKRTEKALWALSSRQEALLMAVPEIIMEVDCNKVYTWVNRAGFEFFGEDVIGKEASFYFEGEQDTYGAVQPLFNGDDQVFYVESWQRRRDGQKRLLAWWCRVLKDARGTITGALSSARDITEQRRAEKALRESKQVIEGILSTLPVRVFWKDKNLVYLGCNTIFARDAGFSDPKDLIGKNDYQTGWRDQAELYRSDDRQVIESGCSKFLIEEPQTTPEGNTITLLTSKIPLRNSKGEISGVLGTYMDITERKRAEDALRDSEEKMRYIVKHTPNAVAVYDRELHYIAVSERYLQDYGVKEKDIIGKHHYEVFPEMPQKWKDVHQRCLAGATERNDDDSFERPDGSITYNRWECRPWRRVDGEIGGIITYTEVTTERKLAEQAVQREKKILQSILEDTLAGYWDWDLRTNEEYLSPTFKRMFGYQDHELPNAAETWQKLIISEDLPYFMELFSKHVSSQGRIPFYNEVRYRHKNGSTVWVICAGRIIEWDETGRPRRMVGCHIDITERKRAEAAIKDSEARFRTAFENAAVGMAIVNKDGLYIETNCALAKMLGYDPSDLNGKPVADFTHPDDLRLRSRFIIDLIEGRIKSGEQERRFVHRNGSTVYALIWASVQRDENGKFLYFISLVQDLTEKKKTQEEKQKAENQLRQLQKMEAMGTLAGGIAHDFNNILGVIIGNSELLNMRDEISESSRESVNQVLAASQRAKQLVGQILAFSRQTEQQKIIVNLKPVIKEAIEFLRASLPTTIQLKQYIKQDAGAIIADPTQMQQILMNLCTNAAHAMEERGGDLKIELDNATVSEDDNCLAPGAEAGNYVKLTVSDTGHGMEPWVQERIFDPYFTTKAPGKGTGLGLSVVHGIVKAHGGMIKVYSEVGKGTTFRVFLPIADGVEEVQPKTDRVLPKGTERILFVDDEAALADLAKRMLGFLGYQVEVRTSPIEALELLRANPERFDAVITDMTMPQMTGLKLAREIQTIRPGLPTILCTGFSNQANEVNAQAAGICALLFKPLLIGDLANELRRVLDEK